MAKEVIFNMFQEVKSPANRAWNQLQYARNLEDIHGDKVSTEYFERLTEAEKQNVLVIATRILIKGEEFVLKEVMVKE